MWYRALLGRHFSIVLQKNETGDFVSRRFSSVLNGISYSWSSPSIGFKGIKNWIDNYKVSPAVFLAEFFERNILKYSKRSYYDSRNRKNNIYPKISALFVVACVFVFGVIFLGNAIILLDKDFQCVDFCSKAVNIGFGILLLLLFQSLIVSLFVFGGKLCIFQ